MKGHLKLAASPLVLLMAVVGHAPAAYAQGGPNAESASLGDIVVTARKRSETLLDTPLSIAAVSGEDLAARGLVTLNEIATATPGLNIQSGSTGRSDRSVQAISLRGFAPTTGTAIVVSTFIDGVPVASSTAVTSIADPERVEILKGPQAAYFGRNTFAGAINVVNKLPGNELSGKISATAGSRDYRDIQGSLEGAIIDDVLSFRVSGRDFSRGGSYKNAWNGDRLGDQSSKTGTLMIVAKPVQDLTIKAFGMLSRDDDGPAASGAMFAWEMRANNGQLNVPAISGSNAGTLLTPSQANCTYNGLLNGISADEPRVSRPGFCGQLPNVLSGFSPIQNNIEDALLKNALQDGTGRVVDPKNGVQGFGMRRNFRHAHLNIDYDLGDSGFTLSSMTGYNREEYSTLSTLNNYDTTLIANPLNPTGSLNARASWANFTLVERYTQDFSQELRVSYDNDGPLTGTIGGSYLFTKSQPSYANLAQEVMGAQRSILTTSSARQQAKTLAAFFGVSYDVTDRFTISADGRYQRDRIFFFAGPRGLNISPTNPHGLPAGQVAPHEQAFYKDFKTFLPRIIAQYDVTDDMMAYASFSKGANITLSQFNSNVFNGSPTVVAAAESIGLSPTIEPERLNNYEIGLKGKAFDGMLTYQIAAYYAQWRDQFNQRTTFIIDEPPPTGTGAGAYVTGTSNGGNINMKGLEVDLTAMPTDGLMLNFSGAINDSDIQDYSNPQFSKLTGVIGDGFKGNQLANSSKYSAVFGAQYGQDIAAWDEGSWFIRGDVSYKSKIFANEANLAWIPSRTVANFRAGISRGPFSLEAFMLNAFNNKNYTSVLEQNITTPTVYSEMSATGYVLVGMPELRSYGLKASFKF